LGVKLASAAEGDARESDDPVFDLSIYRQLEEALGDDGAAAVLNTFMTDTDSRLEVIRRHEACGDAEGLRREAHTTKSSAAMLGFLQLSALAAAMEKDAMQLDPTTLSQRIGELEQAYRYVRDRVADARKTARAA